MDKRTPMYLSEVQVGPIWASNCLILPLIYTIPSAGVSRKKKKLQMAEKKTELEDRTRRVGCQSLPDEGIGWPLRICYGKSPAPP